MKYAIVVLFSCLLVKTAFCDDKECKAQFKKVMECFKKKHEDNKAADEQKVKELEANIDKCFKDAGCDAPNYSGDNKENPMAQKMKQKFDEQPEDVKKCVKDEFKKVMMKKVNECLKEKGVATISDDDADDNLLEEFHGDKNGEEERKKMAHGIAAVGAALKKCNKDKGESARNKVVSCIKPLKESIKKEMCKRKDECKAQVKVSDACQKRFEEVKNAMCQCKEDKLKDAKKKVEALQAKGGDVSADEVKDISGAGGPGAMMKDFSPDTIENCYKKNNKLPPPELAALKLILKTKGKGLFQGKITQEQLQKIHDHIEEELEHHDCKMCS